MRESIRMFLHMYMHRAWYHTIIAVKCNIIKIHGFAGNIIAISPCDPRGTYRYRPTVGVKRRRVESNNHT